jgi:hypothetical protein
MLWTIIVILGILWLLGFSFHVGGGLIQSGRPSVPRQRACLQILRHVAKVFFSGSLSGSSVGSPSRREYATKFASRTAQLWSITIIELVLLPRGLTGSRGRCKEDLQTEAVVELFRRAWLKQQQAARFCDDERPDRIGGTGEELVRIYMKRAAPPPHFIPLDV